MDEIDEESRNRLESNISVQPPINEKPSLLSTLSFQNPRAVHQTGDREHKRQKTSFPGSHRIYLLGEMLNRNGKGGGGLGEAGFPRP